MEAQTASQRLLSSGAGAVRSRVVCSAVCWGGMSTTDLPVEVVLFSPWSEATCQGCGKPCRDHGWCKKAIGLDGEEGALLCPGDWLVTSSEGTRALSPGLFRARYAAIEPEELRRQSPAPPVPAASAAPRGRR